MGRAPELASGALRRESTSQEFQGVAVRVTGHYDDPAAQTCALTGAGLENFPPDLIVLSGPIDEYRTVVADNLRHPALTALMRTRKTTTLPWRLWLCATPHLADAVERLAAVRATMTGRAAVR